MTPADYDTYCITAPIDSRLPGWRRLSGVRPGRRQARTSSARCRTRDRVEEVRDVQELERLLQRHHRRAAAAQHLAGRRRRHRPLGAGPLLRRRLAAGAVELPRRHARSRRRRRSSCTACSPFKAGFVASFAWQNLSGPGLRRGCDRSTPGLHHADSRIAQDARPSARRAASRPRQFRWWRRRRCSKTRISRLDLRLSKAFRFNRLPDPGQSRCLQRVERQLGPSGHHTTARVYGASSAR